MVREWIPFKSTNRKRVRSRPPRGRVAGPHPELVRLMQARAWHRAPPLNHANPHPLHKFFCIAIINSNSNKVISGSNKVISGPNKVRSGDNLMAPGSNKVSSGDNLAASGSDKVSPGDNLVAPGSNKVSSGENLVTPGSAKVRAGFNQVVSGKNQAGPGSNEVLAGFNKVGPGFDFARSGSLRLRWRPFRDDIVLGEVADFPVQLQFVTDDLPLVFDSDLLVLKFQRLHEGHLILGDLPILQLDR